MDSDLASNVEEMHAEAWGWALHCCEGSPLAAEEVLQNAYLKVLQGGLCYSGRSSLKTWWFGVIRMTAREDARRRFLRQKILGRFWLQGAGQEQEPPASRRLELSEQSQELMQAMRSLPARQAEVLHLVFYQDLTLNEAAAVMGITLGSVRQHYERGKARLRQLLGKENRHDG